jgi:hypothetical protein
MQTDEQIKEKREEILRITASHAARNKTSIINK